MFKKKKDGRTYTFKRKKKKEKENKKKKPEKKKKVKGETLWKIKHGNKTSSVGVKYHE